MAEPTVLIIDEDQDLTAVLELYLSNRGCRVLKAANGEAGLETLRQQAVDLVLTDFMMPELNGLGFTQTVRDHPEWFQTRILFMSSNVDPEFRKRAIQLGAIDYLAKSSGAEAIADRVMDSLQQDDCSGGGAKAQPSAEVTKGENVSLLVDHLCDVLDLAGPAEQLPVSTASALRAARRLAHKIRDVVTGDIFATQKPADEGSSLSASEKVGRS